MRSTLKERRRARIKYQRAKKKPLGEGSRFAAIAESARLGGAENPEAVAASIGREKYGKRRFQKLSIRGKKEKRPSPERLFYR